MSQAQRGSAGGGSSSPTVKVSAADTTANYLENKIVAGTNVTITKLNAGGNEQLRIAASGGGGGTGNSYFPGGW